ncbi:Serine/threonine kinase, partial [hydrothermal vent metagenome]
YITNLSAMFWVLISFLSMDSGVAQSKFVNDSILIQKIEPTSISFEMIQIPGAIYKMGSSNSDSTQISDENPLHLVQIDSMWVGKYEVTWEIFELFLAENKILFDSISLEKSIRIDAITRPSPPFVDPSLGMGKDNYPVVSISPYAAITFCKWLSTVTGRFYRLPTEAEWEYICKGGTSDIDFFNGKKNILEQYAWSYENSNYQYAKVGQKLPNAFGVYDILGNVAEWTLDQYDEEFYKKEKDTIALNPWNIPKKIHPRVYRGGSWNDDSKDLSSTKRYKSGFYLQKDDPQIPKSLWWYTNSSFIGFRLVSPYNQPTENEIKIFWRVALNEQ